MSKEGFGNSIQQLIPQSQQVGRQLIFLEESKKQFHAVVPHVSNIKTVIGSELVLEAQRPLLHIGGRAKVFDCIGELADIGQSPGRLARWQDQAAGERIAEQVCRSDAIDCAHVRSGLCKTCQAQSLIVAEFHGRDVEHPKSSAHQ